MSDKPTDKPVHEPKDGDQLDQATKQQPSTPPAPESPAGKALMDAKQTKDEPVKPPKPINKKRPGKLRKGSYVILETGTYIGQLARIDEIDVPAETVKVSVETGGDPFYVPWPDGVRAAKGDEIPDYAVEPPDEDDED